MCFYLLLALLGPLHRPATTPAPAPQPHRLEATPAFTLPFKLVGGLVVLRDLRCNGQRGDFILDTGSSAPLVVDSGPFAQQLSTTQPPQIARGQTGRVVVQALAVREFALGPARFTGFAAQAFALDHLRRYTGGPLLGFIGYGLLQHFEVVLDYAQRRVSFYSLRVPHPARRPFTRRDSVAFTLVPGRGFPVAAGFIGQAPVRWLLDTGAADNQLDTTFCRTLPLPDRPQPGAAEPSTGADGHRQLVRRSMLREAVVGETSWQGMPVQLAAFARPANGQPLPYQGVLGFPYLSQDKLVSFHYGRQQFYALVPTRTTAPAAGVR
ncbi:pepsin/retropepsin-like aspartic protease family protein [Hymenobacter sp. UV11]|uniref:pepsin/retropepsin-like aspartic protease family protein n=1 Tax=Hymenobacter sp. UV11 TaxID=1849735 RepID=UPI0010D82830|nr:pepsin/retropepsin-like aspartic protease family protein [Hymenobacter sp. UV11]TDN38274.1 hypothetical protein A8B98_25035 [Hymenobacter sp. UV11]